MDEIRYDGCQPDSNPVKSALRCPAAPETDEKIAGGVSHIISLQRSHTKTLGD